MKTLTGICLWITLLTVYCNRQCSSTSIPPTPITASECEDVLLRCDCEDAEKVVWQTRLHHDDDEETLIISYNKSDPVGQKRSDLFKNRVRVFLGEERGNCSLQLLNVTAADQRVYTCYGWRSPLIIKEVSLSVRTKQFDPSPTPSTGSGQSISIAVGLSVILALVAVFSGLLVCRWRRQRRQQESAPTEEEVQFR